MHTIPARFAYNLHVDGVRVCQLDGVCFLRIMMREIARFP